MQKRSEKPEKVLLSIIGTSAQTWYADEETQEIRFMTEGELFQTTDGYSLTYQETDPDNGLVCTVVMTFAPACITMKRSGEYNTEMVFRKGRRFEGMYGTPYGELSMAVFTTALSWEIQEELGNAIIAYQIDLQGHFAAQHRLNLRFARGEARE